MDERFLKMEIKDWADEPLVIYDGDTYFFDSDALRDYLLESDEDPEKVRLCICEPNMPREIDPADYFCDDLPEDGELNDDQLMAAFDLVNEMIRKSGPLSWSQGGYVARLPPEFIAEIKAQRATAE
ncbi:putative prophage PSSB64-02 [Pseudomonas amygdali pv. myricae]|nr:putative prophage PSSB64-02 [Pseudomonas amygdali pv. myricae]